jgi:hypothetical protein
MVTLLEEEHVDVVAGICGEEELRWWCETSNWDFFFLMESKLRCLCGKQNPLGFL